MTIACKRLKVLSAWLVPIAVLVAAPTPATANRADLEGTWLNLRSEVGPIHLTPAGEAALAGYVPLRDDPDLRCVPASLTNVIGIPDPPWEIVLHDDYVEINFEYMDVRRRVPLDPELSVADAPFTVAEFPHLGRSVGRFERGVLIIETADVGQGYVSTLFKAEGHPQSPQMRYEERYRAEDDRLFVEITHTDSGYYTAPLTMRFEFFRVDLEVMEFGCELDAANYDDRL